MGRVPGKIHRSVQIAPTILHYFINYNMGINRRGFFKTLGVTGATLALGTRLGAEVAMEEKTEFHGLLFDSTRCIGCRYCEVVCAETHKLPVPKGKLKTGVLRRNNETQRTVINKFATSKGEVCSKKQCMHCNEPACAAACLTQAMHKTKEGPVIWRSEKCMGCRYCMVSCPFDAPKFEYHSSNPKIQKCDMCYDRIKEGKIPACAEACGDALIFGTRRDLIAEARKRIAENPNDYIDQIYGETIAGGTGFLHIGPVPFKELGVNTELQNASYPALTKGFLYSVPAVFVLLPSILLGIHEATKNNQIKDQDDEQS
jgi:Fe-S-cluster-containing dehydrogenase component